jgi:hypothetical protein
VRSIGEGAKLRIIKLLYTLVFGLGAALAGRDRPPASPLERTHSTTYEWQ